jgi:hypothetical protein
VIQITRAQLADIRLDAEFTQSRVGAPGCEIRKRAAATVKLVDAYREQQQLIRDLRALLPEEVVT